LGKSELDREDRCHVCDKPRATQADHDATAEGEGDHLCWAAWGTRCSPVDWRERALAAQVERDKLAAALSKLNERRGAELIVREERSRKIAALEVERDTWAERARASFWLAAWRGISHDVVAGIIGGPMLGRSADVLRRVQRHTRAAHDRGER
jgi:hypothetical protein